MVQSGIGPGLEANLRPLYRALFVLSLCLAIRAQNTTGVEDVTCPELGLASPSGSSPCRSLVRVMLTCTGTIPLILPINQQPLAMYGPPTGDDTTFRCECTDVVYNLFSACAACQNSTDWYTHDQWFRPCPQDRPDMTINSEEVINWNNHTYQPTFDVPTALAIAQGLPPPEPSATQSAVTSSGSVTASSESKHSSNTGAIAGGVVGGVAFLAIVGFLIFFCIRKRKSRRIPPSAEFMKYAEAQGINNAAVPLTHMHQTEDDPRISQSHPHGRNSILNLNNANSSTRSPSALGVSRNNTDEGDAPPAFTTGLFKDPIFEKGVALNLAGAASAASAASHGGPASASSTGHGPNPLTQTPITYSPASTMFHPENQRLIHERQMSS